jgi:hypothetical protein
MVPPISFASPQALSRFSDGRRLAITGCFTAIVDCICDCLCCGYVVYAHSAIHLCLEDKCILKHETIL